MIWGNLKLRLIQTSRMAKSNQLFVISFALREPCLKLIKGQANMLLYELVPKIIGFFARLMITPGVNKVLFFLRPSPFFFHLASNAFPDHFRSVGLKKKN